MKIRKTSIESSGPDIFADLGFADADSHFLKAHIVAEVYRLANERKLTQIKVGKLLGISQPEVFRLFKGQFREYSIERLMRFLARFDRDVEIVARPRRKKGEAGRITFSALAS